MDDFVYDFERQPGEEIMDYDTRFIILLRRLAGQVNPLIKEKAMCQLRSSHRSLVLP